MAKKEKSRAVRLTEAVITLRAAITRQNTANEMLNLANKTQQAWQEERNKADIAVRAAWATLNTTAVGDIQLQRLMEY